MDAVLVTIGIVRFTGGTGCEMWDVRCGLWAHRRNSGTLRAMRAVLRPFPRSGLRPALSERVFAHRAKMQVEPRSTGLLAEMALALRETLTTRIPQRDADRLFLTNSNVPRHGEPVCRRTYPCSLG